MERTFNPSDIRLIAGVGNPGRRYEKTYHNAGRLLLMRLAENTERPRHAPGKHFSYTRRDNILFVLSEIFMNDSGQAVREAMEYFKTPTDSLIVAHDDADLALGKFKLQFGRGTAGHRGIVSIVRELGSQDFWRVRIGIRAATAAPNRLQASAFVLKKISRDAQKPLEAVFRDIEKTIFPSPERQK